MLWTSIEFWSHPEFSLYRFPPNQASDIPAAESATPVDADAAGNDFSDLKKKKKSKKAVFDIDELEGSGEASGSTPKAVRNHTRFICYKF